MAEQTLIAPAASPIKSSSFSILRLLLGLLALAPICLASLLTQIIPTVGTLLISFQKDNLMSAPVNVGMDNYVKLLQAPVFTNSLVFTLLIMIERLLVLAAAPLLLAYGLSRLGSRLQALARVLLMIPAVLAAPVALGLAWRLYFNPASGPFKTGGVLNPGNYPAATILLDSLLTLLLALGVGVVIFLLSFKSGLKRPAIAVWLVGLLAAVAFSLQTFTMIFIFSGGGPGYSTTTLAILLYDEALKYFNFGPAAVTAVFILAGAGLCGLAAGLVIVFSRLQVQMVEARQPASAGEKTRVRSLGAIALVIALVFILPACLIVSLVMGNEASAGLQALPGGARQLPISGGQALLNALLPLLISTFVIQLPLAYLGALGIGAARPFGRWSEALLLLFSPGLFLTTVPLSLFFLKVARQADLFNTFTALIGPVAVNVAALFILTLFFKGQEIRLRAAGVEGKTGLSVFFSKLILPSLPLALLLGLVTVWVGLQELFWPLMVTAEPKSYTFNLLLMLSMNTGQPFQLSANSLVSLGLPLGIVFLVIFVLFQIFYLGKLEITSGEK